MPVNRGDFIQAIGDVQRYRVAFPPAQQRRRQRLVHRHGDARLAGEVHRCRPDGQIELRTGQCRKLVCARQPPRRGPPQTRAHDDATHRETLHECASRELRDAETCFHGLTCCGSPRGAASMSTGICRRQMAARTRLRACATSETTRHKLRREGSGDRGSEQRRRCQRMKARVASHRRVVGGRERAGRGGRQSERRCVTRARTAAIGATATVFLRIVSGGNRAGCM